MKKIVNVKIKAAAKTPEYWKEKAQQVEETAKKMNLEATLRYACRSFDLQDRLSDFGSSNDWKEPQTEQELQKFVLDFIEMASVFREEQEEYGE